MNVAAPVEAEKVVGKKAGNIVQFPHKQEAVLRDRITQSTQAAGYPVTVEHTIPSASGPLPNTPELKHVKAIRIGAELMGDLTGSDLHNMLPTLETSDGGVASSKHVRTTSGHKIISLIRGRKAA